MSIVIEQLQRLALQLLQQGRTKEAIDAHLNLIKHQPKNIEALYNLGYLLKIDGQYPQALEAYSRALALGISQPEEVHLNMAVIYSDHLRRDADAERELKLALSKSPEYAPALLNLGNLYEEQGKRDEAINYYERILILAGKTIGSDDPNYLSALARMAHLRPPQDLHDKLFIQLHNATKNAKKDEDRANLFFALGRAYDALGDFDSAFTAFSNANHAVKPTGPSYDRIKLELYVDALIKAFPIQNIAPTQNTKNSTYSPLFICGMYRSGSTLVEQVLAAHPDVVAGGELNLLPTLASKTLAPFPQTVALMTDQEFQTLANDYLEQLRFIFQVNDDIRYITDKRPDNFMLIGLIKKLFPHAKIIHTTRQPLDNGLSVFMQHLHPSVAGYASDLIDIGHYYAQYRRLMAHWNCLYNDAIYQFDYDTFVSEPTKTLTALLNFLNLEMDDRCLEFHKLDNTVKTASYWQVRQPLYSNASGRWQNYRQNLLALEHELGLHNITY
jgi:tetratricopeptide (TPR) repeat protein